MEIAGFSYELLGFLFVIAIVSGFLDTLAGGGGLITIPALMMSGLPPLAALGTNKFQSCFGTGTATLIMIRKRKVRWSEVRYLMLAAFIGSAVGAAVVQFINVDALNFIIPSVLVIIAVYFLVSPMPHNEGGKPKISADSYRQRVIPIIGAYDGMFGPGTGSFFNLAGISLQAQPLLKSTVIAKTLNFATNVASFIVFMFVGQVVWVVGAAMLGGQLIGAWLGAHCLFKINVKLLRILVVMMCVGMLIKYVHSMDLLPF